MATEIEYRYLLPELPRLGGTEPSNIVQGYLQRSFERTHRIRIEDFPDGTSKGYETIKGPKVGPKGSEDEKEILLEDARQKLAQCEQPYIYKDRFKISVGNNLKWEVDSFKGKLRGLFIAEIELPSEDTPYKMPRWLKGVNITEDKRFANALLVDIERPQLIENIKSVLEPAGFIVDLEP